MANTAEGYSMQSQQLARSQDGDEDGDDVHASSRVSVEAIMAEEESDVEGTVDDDDADLGSTEEDADVTLADNASAFMASAGGTSPSPPPLMDGAAQGEELLRQEPSASIQQQRALVERVPKQPSWTEVGEWTIAEDSCTLQRPSDVNGPDGENVGFSMPRPIYDQLYTYQRHAVAWMWSLFRASFGGILADEMGLGKTVQACAFMAGLKASGHGTHFLVAVPVTLLEHWRREALAWGRGVGLEVHVLHGGPRERRAALSGVMRRGGVLLTTYDLIRTSINQICTVGSVPAAAERGKKRKRACPDDDSPSEDEGPPLPAGERRPWDLCMIDEAHRIKNPSCVCGRALRRLESRCRVLLSGTPLQNQLSDLWALMDFAQPGLLGNHATFDRNFSEQIAKGSKRNATRFAVELKDSLSRELKRLTSPHFLRRTKQGVAAMDGSQAADGTFEELPRKTDVVLWVNLAPVQRELYSSYLSSDLVRHARGSKQCGMEALRAIALLKKLCNHPIMCMKLDDQHAWRQAAMQAKESAAVEDAQDVHEPEDGDVNMEAGVSNVEHKLRTLIPKTTEGAVDISCKLRVLQCLLPALERSGHRVLLFSQSTRMLDLVQQCVLRPLGLKFLRIDGTIDPKDRDAKVNKFQTNDRYFAFCLSTAVGGVGLTLTAADRVVLLDPAWNPAMDEQAVDRVHRIGQTKEIVVYRLICSGAIEDKMFRLQVFKRGLAKSTFESANQLRFFSHKELKSLFEPLGDGTQNTTQDLMAQQLGNHALEHGDLLATVQEDVGDPEDEQALFWRSTDILGFSDYHKLFTKLEELEASPEDNGSAHQKAQAIADALREEEYMKDQVEKGMLKPNFGKRLPEGEEQEEELPAGKGLQPLADSHSPQPIQGGA